MSDSHKHNPHFGITTAESEKKDKRFANRKLRRAVTVELEKFKDNPDLADDIPLPEMREVSDAWTFDKDGKPYWNPDPTLPENNVPRSNGKTPVEIQRELMRK